MLQWNDSSICRGIWCKTSSLLARGDHGSIEDGVIPHMTEIEDLRAQLQGALMSRAMVYAAVYDEIAKEFDEAKAEEILKRAIYARGAAIGDRFSGHAPADFAALRDAFLDFVPDHGRLFRPEVVRCDGEGLDIKFHACPLKEAWEEAGFAPERVETLCRIAGIVDRGTFEQAGFALQPDTWKVGGEGCCFLHIRRKA
jgi:hypothetical protein